MREVELKTRDGDFVAVVEIAPFPDAGMPEVVMWGDRVFISELATRHQLPDDSPARWAYREGCAVVSFTPSPGLQK